MRYATIAAVTLIRLCAKPSLLQKHACDQNADGDVIQTHPVVLFSHQLDKMQHFPAGQCLVGARLIDVVWYGQVSMRGYPFARTLFGGKSAE
jgi:hypothetical protein